jgi:methylmalonyl-CoA mutase
MCILGLSSLAAAHLTAVPEVKAALKKQGRVDIMIIIGGECRRRDYDARYKAGAKRSSPRHAHRRCRRRADPQAQREIGA